MGDLGKVRNYRKLEQGRYGFCVKHSFHLLGQCQGRVYGSIYVNGHGVAYMKERHGESVVVHHNGVQKLEPLNP